MNIIAIRKTILLAGQTIQTVRNPTQLFSCNSGTSYNLKICRYFLCRATKSVFVTFH